NQLRCHPERSAQPKACPEPVEGDLRFASSGTNMGGIHETDTLKEMKRVILYSQPGCPPCYAAKQFFAAHNIPFEYKDVQADPAALRELVKLNSRSTPTIVVGDEVMIGFDPDRLEALLAVEQS
ncbi:MAG: glutaredoxin family protein, partial [Silvibacterium sp.]